VINQRRDRFCSSQFEFLPIAHAEYVGFAVPIRRPIQIHLIHDMPSFSMGSFLMYRTTLLAAAIATTVLCSPSNVANAQQPAQKVQVGVLECRGGATVGFIVGAVVNLGCVLRVNGMPEDHYVATIQKIGLDIGFTETTALAWNVFAPVAQPGRGDIAGTHVGADAMAAAVVGVGGNVLLGGSNNSIALHPISVQAETGVIVACGAGAFGTAAGKVIGFPNARSARG
jgi:hypothetical protein